jgi:hypothetical protein
VFRKLQQQPELRLGVLDDVTLLWVDKSRVVKGMILAVDEKGDVTSFRPTLNVELPETKEAPAKPTHSEKKVEQTRRWHDDREGDRPC